MDAPFANVFAELRIINHRKEFIKKSLCIVATERKALFRVEVVLHIPDLPLGQLTARKLRLTSQSFQTLNLLVMEPEKGKTLRVIQMGVG